MNVKLPHLAVVLGVTTLMAGVGGVLGTYLVVEEEVQELLDEDLDEHVEFLARVLAMQDGSISATQLQALIEPTFEADQEETLWVNVYYPSTGAHVSNLPHALPMPAPGSGQIALELQDHQWFGYQHSAPGGPVVQLLHRDDRYHEVREEVLEDVALPALAAVGSNLLLLGGFLYLALWPVTRLVGQLESRRSDSLQPLVIATPTREAAVLRDAINGFLTDIRRVLGRERDFASDVAHELRTPLTTLKLELSSASPDVEALRAEAERLSRLVNQLLTLARLQRTDWRESFSVVDLERLCADRIAAMRAELAEAGIFLDAHLERAPVQGDEVLLDVLLRNLLENVKRHCPSGTHADVVLTGHEDRVVLAVRDSGPGVDPEGLKRLNVGISRLDRRSEGLGLGHTICQKIAAIHDASLEFRAGEHGVGLEVRLVFPREQRAGG